MKKLIRILCFAIASITVTAQKADISSEKIAMTFELSDDLKDLKTFSYQIQDDGTYWNYTPSPEYYPKDEYPHLTSLTDGITIDGMEAVEENADLQILVGFLGNQLSVSQYISMKGTFCLMLFTKENKLIHSYTTSVSLSQLINSEKFPMDTRDERNQTKARMLTLYTQEYLDKNQYLFKENSTRDLPFGLFKKTKGGAAEAFNTQSKPLIAAIVNNPSDITTLDKAISYWKSQIAVDFGRKVKDKVKNKVLYVNLTSASILKKDIENTNTYYKIAKKSSGFFDSWPGNYTSIFKIQEALKLSKKKELPTLNILPNTVYYITLDGGGTYTYKDKKTVFSKIEIERFVITTQSGIVSLDSTKKPKIYIYEDDVKSLRHFGSAHNKISTNDGKELIFKKVNSVFIPYIKQVEGSYIPYESN